MTRPIFRSGPDGILSLSMPSHGISLEVRLGRGDSARTIARRLARAFEIESATVEIIRADHLHPRCGCNAHLFPYFGRPTLVECSACGACWEWGRP